MEKLNVRFSDTQKLKVGDVSVVIDVDFSSVARAAMALGIQQIITLAAVDKRKAVELVIRKEKRKK